MPIKTLMTRCTAKPASGDDPPMSAATCGRTPVATEPCAPMQVRPVNGLVQQQQQEGEWAQKLPEESIGQSEANARPGATHIPLKQQAKAGTDDDRNQIMHQHPDA
jgi:hypothetical protein